MSIRKKIEVNPIQEEKKKLEFISKGGSVASDKKRNDEFTNINLRVPNSILVSIDLELQKRPWMNRTQWIMDAVAAKIEGKDE